MKAFVRSVSKLVKQGEPFVMATVVESSGSTPRSSGAKMAVLANGSSIGTIGGGLAEANACTNARDMLTMTMPNGKARLIFVDMTQELAADSDMICGGGLSIFLEVVTPNTSCAKAYLHLDELLRKGTPSTLTTHITGTDSLHAIAHGIRSGHPKNRAPILEKNARSMRLMEPFVPPASLYIFGAGHVAFFTARLGAMVGFRTVVLDDRAEYANAVRFPEADEVVVLPSFAGCCDGHAIGENAFIVIVTRGHLHDRTVLAECLRTRAKYIGMIGSRKKRDTIYATLLADGFTQADIDRCHCPIGLPIGGQTPEEIAVSIMAELIQTRTRHRT